MIKNKYVRLYKYIHYKYEMDNKKLTITINSLALTEQGLTYSRVLYSGKTTSFHVKTMSKTTLLEKMKFIKFLLAL